MKSHCLVTCELGCHVWPDLTWPNPNVCIFCTFCTILNYERSTGNQSVCLWFLSIIHSISFSSLSSLSAQHSSFSQLSLSRLLPPSDPLSAQRVWESTQRVLIEHSERTEITLRQHRESTQRELKENSESTQKELKENLERTQRTVILCNYTLLVLKYSVLFRLVRIFHSVQLKDY